MVRLCCFILISFILIGTLEYFQEEEGKVIEENEIQTWIC